MNIDYVKIRYVCDDYPDLTHYGEFTSEYQKPEDIKRGSVFVHDEGNSRTHDYFICTNTVEDQRKDLQRIGYSKGVAETMARLYCKSDYNRMLDFEAGRWQVIGIIAEACISYSTGNGHRRLETFQSSGIWGVELDSGNHKNNDYIKDLEQEQIEDLKKHLESFGIDTTDFEKHEIVKGEIEY